MTETEFQKLSREEQRRFLDNGGMSDAQVAATNSEQYAEAVSAEFARRTGCQLNQADPRDRWAAQEIVDLAKARHPGPITADGLCEAWDIHCASRMSQDDLKRVIQERERAGR